jgi:hypothetical protein
VCVRVGEGPGEQAGVAGGPGGAGHRRRKATADATAAEVRGDGQERELGRAVVLRKCQSVEAALIVN